jgi:hypothetical protein
VEERELIWILIGFEGGLVHQAAGGEDRQRPDASGSPAAGDLPETIITCRFLSQKTSAKRHLAK